VKLLLDQNLSFRLLAVLSRYFPGSQHVRYANLDRATDREVWEYARVNGYGIISKDGDFHQLSLLLGAPPKVIWIQTGNASTSEISNLIKDRSKQISAFLKAPDASLLWIT
jgi:predicted nuclease of predicted toxin-antitoxin system